MQHVAAAMDASAAQLTAAVAALAAATAAASSSSGSSGGAAGSVITLKGSAGCLLRQADGHSALLLGAFQQASCTLSSTGHFSLEASLPAAPAAVRLILSAFRAYSGLQQLGLQQELQPIPNELPHPDLDVSSEQGRAFPVLHRAMKVLTAHVDRDGVIDMLQSCPSASKLLLLPEFVSCLAIMAAVTVLGLDVSGNMPRAAGPPAAGSSSVSEEGSSSTRSSADAALQQAAPVAGRRRQQQQQAGSIDNGSSSGLGNGMRLDSLTPLSCTLFDSLGVTKETVLQAARLAKADGLTTTSYLHMYMVIYNSVLGHQVSVLNS